MDEELRALQRRRDEGDARAAHELERLRRRGLGFLDSAILRLCMAAKVAWGVNLNRRDRSVITRELVGAMNARAACDWKKGAKLVVSRHVLVRGISGNIQTDADTEGLELTLHPRGSSRRQTKVIFTRATIDALAARYPAPLVEALEYGVRINSLGAPAVSRGLREEFTRTYEEGMRRAFDQFRLFQNEPGRPIGTNHAQAQASLQSFNEGVGKITDVRWYLPRLVPKVRPWTRDEVLNEPPTDAMTKHLEEVARRMTLDYERRALDLLSAPLPHDGLNLFSTTDQGRDRFGVQGGNMITPRIDRGQADARSPAPPSH